MTQKEVATEILRQLGGSKFITMTGSRNFAYDTNTLSMQLRRNKAKAKWLKITLNVMDTYDMQFIDLDKDHKLVVKAEKKNVYNDQLQEIFTSVTGLETSLGTMGR